MTIQPVWGHAIMAISCSLLACSQSKPTGVDWPDLDAPSATTGGGERDAAVIVGISRYTYVANVPGATKNAEDWYRWLTQTRRVPPENTILLRDDQAYKDAILAEVSAAAERVGAGGTLWFVFIGHGAPSSDQQDGMLVGVDARQSAMGLYAGSLTQRQLFAAARGRQRRTVAVIDACFSGRSSSGDALAVGLQPLLPVREQPVPDAAVVLTAGKSDEFAGPLPGTGRPAFSYLVLGALRGWGDADGDGAVSADEAVYYARRAIQATVRDRRQTPQLAGDGGPVIATDAHERGPDLTAFVLGPGAPPAPPPIQREPCQLKYDGLYQATVGEGAWGYLRFYPEGRVSSVSSSGTAAETARWLNEQTTLAAHGRVTISGCHIAFAARSSFGAVDYDGVIQGATLDLSFHSQINDNRGTSTYRFVAVPGL